MLDSSYKRNHTVCDVLRLDFFSMHNVFKVQPAIARISASFLFVADNTPWSGQITIHLSTQLSFGESYEISFTDPLYCVRAAETGWWAHSIQY